MIDPGPSFRLLAEGEIIQLGDITYSPGYKVWELHDERSKVLGVKFLSRYSPVRRPVRMQSPGWRYLDEGELPYKGDEWSQGPMGWTSCGCQSFAVGPGDADSVRRHWPDPESRQTSGTQTVIAPNNETSEVLQQVPTESIVAQLYRFGLQHPLDEDIPIRKEFPLLCGCGHHDIEPGEDPYAAHTNYVDLHVGIESKFHVHTVDGFYKGIGISKPLREVGFSEQYGEEFE